MKALKKENNTLRTELAAVECELDTAKEAFIETKTGSHISAPFTNDVRKSCYYMLAKNVAITQVSPIIRYVIRNVAHKDIGVLPSKSQVAVMQREAASLSRMQVGEHLINEPNATMHTDGTSKGGHHYSGLQINTASQTLSLGIREITSGTAENYFSAVQSSLSECERIICQNKDVEVNNISKKMMMNIKNLMSDKHVVETKFTKLFIEARGDCLPDIIDKWDELPEDQRKALLHVNKFHCGLHALANAATSCEETLRQHEKENNIISSGFKFRSESNTYSFIKAMCNLFFKDGGGCPGDIQIYLREHGVEKIPLQPFSGSRFNILFYNGGGVFFCKKNVLSYLKEVTVNKNRLHTAILSDISNDDILSGCRALGLINKFMTGPLWRAMVEPDTNILQMSPIYSSMLDSLNQWSVNPDEVLSGTALPFPNAVVEKDDVLTKLCTEDGTDAKTRQLLKEMFDALIPKWERWFTEHLPGGLYSSPSEDLVTQAANVPTTNVISERDFAQLDRARTIAPHANTQYHEGKIMYRNNNTCNWIDEKSSDEQTKIISIVRKDTAQRMSSEVLQKKAIIAEKVKIQKDKSLTFQRKERRCQIQKQKILVDLQKDGGLWQTEEDVDHKLAQLPQRQRRNVVKTQIRARKQLLGQSDVNAALFNFSKNKRQLTTEELLSNLKMLVSLSESNPTDDANTLMEKINMNPSILVNKKCSHCYTDNGRETWWEGRIIKQKKRSVDFVISYEGEDDEIELSLHDLLYDISIGDLIIQMYV